MRNKQKPPTQLYLAFVACTIGLVVWLEATDRMYGHAEVFMAAVCLVALGMQIVTGYPMSRLAVPGEHRTKDPIGYWVSVAITAVLTLFALLMWFFRQGVSVDV